MNNCKKFWKLFLFILLSFLSVFSLAGCSLWNSEKVVAYYDDHDLIYNGQTYYYVTPVTVQHYVKDKGLGITGNGADYVNSIKGDDGYNYIFTSVRGAPGSERALYALDPDAIYCSGTVTGVYIRRDSIHEFFNDDADAIALILSLPEIEGEETYTYKIRSSGSFSHSLYLCYEGCPIGTTAYGYVAYKDKHCIYVSEEEVKRSFEEYNSDNWEVTGIVISDEAVISALKEITGLK